MAECADDPRFDTLEKRRDQRALVNAMVSGFTHSRTVAELVQLFTQHQVPHAPILSVAEALSQPQTVERQMVVEVEHSRLGSIPIVNRPYRYAGADQPPPAAPPALGEQTDAILAQVLGLSDDRIAALRAGGVVA